MFHPYGVGLVSPPFAIVNGQARFNPRATEEQEIIRAAQAVRTVQSFFQEFKRDDGSPVTVEYHYEDGGSFVCIEKAWLEPLGRDVTLTSAEDERMCDWIMENRWHSDHDNGGESWW